MGKKAKFGPGFLVAAAFIGPGTVTSATLAGSEFGYAFIWVVALSIFAAIVLQEMTGRFSLSTRIDVAAALGKFTANKWLRSALKMLALLAIVVGCAAYEAGNIVGGGMGLEILTNVKGIVWVLMISIIAALLLIWNNYKLIEKFLIALVVIMGISFFISCLIVKPNILKIVQGFIPQIPAGDKSIRLILALLGTTVVPYNLFLHSSAILKKWQNKSDIPAMRTDTFLSIGLGGIITISIIVTASAAFFLKGMAVQTPADLSLQLQPLFGKLARVFFGIGMFAAGISSAITAPYAAAWTAKGLFGWKEKDWRFTFTFLFVIAFGAFAGTLSINPIQLILVAQVTNALLLPVVSLFLVYLLNKNEVGVFKNTLVQNFLFLIVFIIILLINLKKIL